MRTRRSLPTAAALLAALAAAACGHAPRPAPFAEAVPAEVTPPTASDFSVYDLASSWRDQAGRERTLGSFAGRAQVVAMVYTSCTHTCPTIVAEMLRLQRGLSPAERARTGFLLVSLDPARDHPAQLASFAAAMRLDTATWTLLTGDEEQVRELAAVLGIRYRPEVDGQISHSNTWLVLDGAGRIVHRQDGMGAAMDASLASVRAAAKSISSPEANGR